MNTDETTISMMVMTAAVESADTASQVVKHKWWGIKGFGDGEENQRRKKENKANTFKSRAGQK